jgi:hypothetical protein
VGEETQINFSSWDLLKGQEHRMVAYRSLITSRSKVQNQLGKVAHACNPSYSRGRDQEDPSLRPAQAINS